MSLDALLPISKTTSPKKRVRSNCITLYYYYLMWTNFLLEVVKEGKKKKYLIMKITLSQKSKRILINLLYIFPKSMNWKRCMLGALLLMCFSCILCVFCNLKDPTCFYKADQFKSLFTMQKNVAWFFCAQYAP